jgi:hypothetical protein
MRFRPEERLVEDRRVAQCLGRVVERVVERLGAGVALGPRVRAAQRLRVRRRRVAVERAAVLLEQRLEVLARVRLERREDVVELDRRRGLRHPDRVARLERGRPRRARLQVDEEVALEEDPWPDLHRRVLVDRQPRLGDLHLDDREVGVLVAADLLDLADVHARDADGRVRPDARRRLEDRADAVALRERDVLREAEVRPDRDERDGDDADHHGARAAAVLARDAALAVAAALVASQDRHQRLPAGG